MPRATQGNSVDPATNIPIPGGSIRTTSTGAIRVTQQTGEAPGGLNELPGTEPVLPSGQEVGLPRGNTDVPETGPLDG